MEDPLTVYIKYLTPKKLVSSQILSNNMDYDYLTNKISIYIDFDVVSMLLNLFEP